MGERLVVAGVLLLVAVAVAVVVRRRRPTAEMPPTFTAPTTLDRADFTRADAPWLVVVFTSSSCSGCAEVAEKARGLESDSVAVQEVEHAAERELHDRYAVGAVPLVVIADAAGTVRAHFFGPVTATDLWASMAELRGEED